MRFLRARSRPTGEAASARQVRERRTHEQALARQRGRMRRRDLEFLPAALEILETPPSPGRLGAMSCIGLLTVAALVWSYVGRVDVVAVAQGKIQAVGRTKMVQPLETGRVKVLNVANGQAVRAGDLLVALDSSVSEADERTLLTSLRAFEAEARRRRAALAVAKSRVFVSPAINWPAEISGALGEREQRILDNDVGQLAAAVASLNATAREKGVERERILATVAAEERLIAVLQERVTMRSTLLDKAVGSKASLMEVQETLETQRTYLANLKGQAAQTLQAIEVVRFVLQKTHQAFLLDNSQKLSDAERQAEDARTKLAKAQLVTGQARLVSPIDGVVEGLTVAIPGQVVQAGESIMQIVPMTGGLEVEGYIPNQDIGFVKPDAAAIVKVDAFPFTRFGMLDATVIRVAEDAIPEIDARQREENPAKASPATTFGGAQRTQNLVFPMTLRLARSSIDVDGRPVRLVPGMSVTIEVKTGSRRILEYLFSPLSEVTSTSMRER